MSQSDLYCRVSRSEQLGVMRSLELLTLPAGRRKRVFKKVSQGARKIVRCNMRQQKTIGGSAFAKRKVGRGKMLRKLGRTLGVSAQASGATLTWRNALTAQIAYRQHHGVAEPFNAAKMARINPRPDHDAPATRKQAKALIQAGYRQYAGKKNGRVRTRKPSQRWIIEHLSQGHAGLLIRQLEGKRPASRWEVTPQARPFLGVTNQQGTELIKTALADERRRT